MPHTSLSLLPRSVYKGKYWGTRVAVKILEAEAVTRRWGRQSEGRPLSHSSRRRGAC
jgi:hypothetical protein